MARSVARMPPTVAPRKNSWCAGNDRSRLKSSTTSPPLPPEEECEECEECEEYEEYEEYEEDEEKEEEDEGPPALRTTRSAVRIAKRSSRVVVVAGKRRCQLRPSGSRMRREHEELAASPPLLEVLLILLLRLALLFLLLLLLLPSAGVVTRSRLR